ncbi:MAG TPA: glycogen/starch synthase [Candidatus Limnocylindrales bacterium]|nr:glycogen/starch synthase [Candidatus Limnocylindrales bacterium]
MRVTFIAAECEPWAKTGGLADVVDALARALGTQPGAPVDAPIDVYLPRYRSVPVPEGAPVTPIRVPDPTALTGTTEVRIVDVAADGYRLRLVDHPPAFDRDGFYGDAAGDYADNAWRFGLFCRAALEAIRADGRATDVLSLHDWHAAPAVVFRDRWYADDPVIGRAAAVMTLHNLAYHGWVPRERLRELGLAVGDPILVEDAGLDLLRAGIDHAELVNTVSPGFAAEALTPQYGMGLNGTLRAKGDRFVGILNGLDTTLWDPATDRDIVAPFSRGDVRGKAACRRELLVELGLDPRDPSPVIGMIGRLDPQKGFDLLAGAAPSLIADARLVVLGSGDAKLVASLRDVAARRPDRVALLERFDRALARRIYAGIDLFAMPSRFEPCGQGQMIALRYGSPPIVRRTGGLRDTVVDELSSPGRGTGFAFDDATPVALLAACRAAIARFATGGAGWDSLVDRGMAQDFDWTTGSAPKYVDAFRRAVEIRATEHRGA